MIGSISLIEDIYDRFTFSDNNIAQLNYELFKDYNLSFLYNDDLHIITINEDSEIVKCITMVRVNIDNDPVRYSYMFKNYESLRQNSFEVLIKAENTQTFWTIHLWNTFYMWKESLYKFKPFFRGYNIKDIHVMTVHERKDYKNNIMDVTSRMYSDQADFLNQISNNLYLEHQFKMLTK